jgi:hypothetical protein
MGQNMESITRYSSMVSTEKPLFESEAAQKKEVDGLLQSNKDLLKEYLTLKRRIEETNLQVNMEIGGTKYSLADLLVLQRKLASTMMMTYNALNDAEGQRRLAHTRHSSPEGKTPHIVRFYKEEEKNQGLRFWQDLHDNITSRLEVINATTDLI